MKKLLVAAMTVGAAVVLSPTAAAEPSWTMPNLIGMDLQGAQDAIQSLTRGAVWFSGSTDLTGKGRAQIIDRRYLLRMARQKAAAFRKMRHRVPPVWLATSTGGPEFSEDRIVRFG
ncbi:hypothetical protein OS121_21050 [Mycolicibacterium mucogenicum]|uniref:hypothetical protein n=1 Tax=Mycolicibacterium mucogenicum TaxID=56689 RepID=UPI002269F4FB|nr:hypothetical protein [Mycolicibacterium mucogenicum]MCX8557541.1 hypothetical protein [Mycolicibacterium mucogenicum]